MGRSKKHPNAKGQWECALCGRWLNPDQYYNASNTANGLQSRCRLCMKITRIAWSVVNGKDFKWDVFPLASDEELKDFSEVLKAWQMYGTKSPAGRQVLSTLREWIRYLDNQYIPPVMVNLPKAGETQTPQTTEVQPDPEYTPYQFERLAPSIIPLGPTPTWWGKHPGDMTESEYDEWAATDYPSDPAKRVRKE